jgi:DNA-binding MarR family transcriptional regulator
MSALSQWMKVSNGNITGVVDRLERDGLVQRQAQADDRRVKLISLTTLGRERFERMAAVHKAWITEVLGGLADEDMGELHRQLVQMSRVLKDRAR